MLRFWKGEADRISHSVFTRVRVHQSCLWWLSNEDGALGMARDLGILWTRWLSLEGIS